MLADVLESRRLFSVTAAMLAGAENIAGNVETDEEIVGGSLLATLTETVVGPATFNGQSCTEIDDTSLEDGGTVSVNTKSYHALTSAGLVGYGSTDVLTSSGSTTDGLTTFSPPQVVIPATMVAGTPYTESTTSTSVQSGAGDGTTVDQESAVYTLEAAQQSITVPAGTYLCYVIDETVTDTSTFTIPGESPSTSGPTTTNTKEYLNPGVGFVEFAVGTDTTQLTSFTGTMGGGGGGGGGGTTGGGGVSKSIGQLDPNFGTGGLAAHNTGFATTNGVALDGTQSVIIGTIGAAPSESFGITRYNSDGSLDTAFGTAGVASTIFGATDDVPTAVDVLPSGGILVAGTATTFTAGVTSGSEFAITKYTAAGALDTTFGGGTGEVLVSFSPTAGTLTNDLVQSMAVTPGGIIYLGGSSNSTGSSGTDFAIAALNADGSVDSSFGTAGKVVQDFSGGDDAINGLALQTNGDIVAAGSATVGGVTEIGLARFLPIGALDLHFGVKGMVTSNVRGVYDSASSVLIQPKGGAIVIGGLSATGSGSSLSSDFVVARYTAAGRLDRTFGGGTVVTSFGQPSAITQLVLQPDGEIVASGKTTASLSSVTPDSLQVAIARYTTKGLLDTSFNQTGKAIVDLSAANVSAGSVHTGVFSEAIIQPLDASSLGAEFAVFTSSEQGAVAVTTGGEILDAGSSGANTVEAELVTAGVDLLATLLSVPPSSIVGGAKGTANVSIAETGTDLASGTVTLVLEVATDNVGDGATTLKSLPEKINLKQKQVHTYKVSFVYPASLSTGSYFLVANVQNGSSPTLQNLNAADEVAASANPIAIAPPSIVLEASALTAISSLVPGKSATFSVTVINNGNVLAKGATTANIILSPDQTAADGTQIATGKLAVGLKPGISRVFKLSVKLPTTVTAGTFFLIAVVDPVNSLGAIDQSDSTVVDATQVTVG